MVSVQDIADRAGVSPATVSRVLSGSAHPIRPATRERVLAAARERDFQPNRVARALATSRTGIIGAVVHDVADPYFGEIIRGLEDAAVRNQQQVLVCSSDRDAARELDYVRSLMGYRVDAIVFCGGGIKDRSYQIELGRLLRTYRRAGGAVVVLAPQPFRAPMVSIDNVEAARAMTAHLLSLGHREIGFVSGPESIATSADRLAGYGAALTAGGQELGADLVVSGQFSCQGGAAAAAKLCARSPGVTAIFAASDVMAFGVLGELARRRIRVPEDISVAGFDDIQMAALFPIPLTTVHVPIGDIAEHAVQAVADQLAGRRAQSRILPAHVIMRASTSAHARDGQHAPAT